jgi:hypothetical protein
MSRLTSAARGFSSLLLGVALICSGCSLLIDSHARARSNERQRDADEMFKEGVARTAVIDKLGDPNETQVINHGRIDRYYLQIIPDPSATSLHKWKTVDFALLLLPEIVMTPMALYGDYFDRAGTKLCNVTYGSDNRITRSECTVLP